MMPRGILPLIVAVFLASFPALAEGTIRRAVAAGPLYPADTVKLRATVERLLDEADPPEPPPGRLVACIVPHDGYGLSGKVAAHAFKHLKPGQFDKVIVLGACHDNTLETCSVAAVDAYLTPFGVVPLDWKDLSVLCRSTLFAARTLRYRHNDFLKTQQRRPLHETEHSIEVVLPFLQHTLGNEFALLPVLVGDLNATAGTAAMAGEKVDVNRGLRTIEKTARALGKQVDDRTLVVVSTNLTHYGNDFAYRPAMVAVDPEEAIPVLDEAAVEFILARDMAGFDRYLEGTGNPICGATAIKVLMELLPPNVQGRQLAYDFSGRLLPPDPTTGEITRSVSYTAINFYAPPRRERVPAPTLELNKEAIARGVTKPETDRPPSRATDLSLRGAKSTGANPDLWTPGPAEDDLAPAPPKPADPPAAADKTPASATTTIEFHRGEVTVHPGATAGQGE